MNLIRPLVLGSIFTLGAGLASAQNVFVGSNTTLFMEMDAVTLASQPIGACGGIIQSAAADGPDLFLGDIGGKIYHYDGASGQVSYSFTNTPNDATALALHDDQLLVGGSDGTVVRLNKLTGQLLATYNAPGPVSAMVVLGDTLLVGTTLGAVFRSPATTGQFTFFGTCGGPVNSMTTDSSKLYIADTFGSIYRLLLSTGQVLNSYPAPNSADAIVAVNGMLLVGGSDSKVFQLLPAGGGVLGQQTLSVPVTAMSLETSVEPGDIYCYGTGCPCANDDMQAGCANSTSVGAGMHGSGTTSVVSDDLTLSTSGLPANKITRMYMSPVANHVPFGDGFLCAGQAGYPSFRFAVQVSSPSGEVSLSNIVSYSHTNFGPSGHILAGQLWNFQGWYRDTTGPCSATFNTTNSYAVIFTP